MTTTNGEYLVEPAQQLQGRLNEPQTAQALNQLLDNAELLAFSLTALDGLLRRGDTIADGIADGLAEVKAISSQNQPQLSEAMLTETLPRLLQQLPQLLSLTEQLLTLTNSTEFQQLLALLSKPQTLNAICQLLENIELIAIGVTALDGLLQRSDTIADNLSATLADAKATTLLAPEVDMGPLLQTLPALANAAPQLVEMLPQLLLLMEKTQPLIESGALESLIDSGVLEPQVLHTIGQAGEALAQTTELAPADIKPLGTLGLLRSVGDPNIQKALGFLMQFANQFGQKIN